MYPALQVLDFNLPSYNQYAKAPGFLTKKIMIEHWLDYMFGHRKYLRYFYENSHVTEEFHSVHSKKVSVHDLPILIQIQVRKYFDIEHIEYYPALYPNKKPTQPKLDRNVLNEIAKLVTNSSLAPLMAEQRDFEMFPPTFILTADIDVLRDEGSIVAKRLRRAGVDVEHVYLKTEEHGCLPFIDVVTSEDLERAYTSFGHFFKQHV